MNSLKSVKRRSTAVSNSVLTRKSIVNSRTPLSPASSRHLNLLRLSAKFDESSITSISCFASFVMKSFLQFAKRALATFDCACPSSNASFLSSGYTTFNSWRRIASKPITETQKLSYEETDISSILPAFYTSCSSFSSLHDPTPSPKKCLLEHILFKSVIGSLLKSRRQIELPNIVFVTISYFNHSRHYCYSIQCSIRYEYDKKYHYFVSAPLQNNIIYETVSCVAFRQNNTRPEHNYIRET